MELTVAGDGSVNGQALQSIRRLTAQSAALLDELLRCKRAGWAARSTSGHAGKQPCGLAGSATPLELGQHGPAGLMDLLPVPLPPPEADAAHWFAGPSSRSRISPVSVRLGVAARGSYKPVLGGEFGRVAGCWGIGC